MQTPKPAPTPEQVCQRALEIHKAQGSCSHPLIDWFQAESELKLELSRLRENNPVYRKIH